MSRFKSVALLLVPLTLACAALAAVAAGGGSGWQPGPPPQVPPCNTPNNPGFECEPNGYCMPGPWLCTQNCRVNPKTGMPEVSCVDTSGSSW